MNQKHLFDSVNSECKISESWDESNISHMEFSNYTAQWPPNQEIWQQSLQTNLLNITEHAWPLKIDLIALLANALI